MKKLTLALLSLMLFLGMGTAFAQTLPTPTFTPGGNGSTGVSAAPGQTITFTMPDDFDIDEYATSMILLCYGFDVDGQLKPSMSEIQNWIYYFQSEGQLSKPSASYEVVAYDGNGSTIVVTIPEDASGMVEFTARLAGITDEDGEAVYSDLMDASYIVQGEVVKPAMPTFSPASGEVEPATKVSISSDASMIWYCINGEDADLTLEGYSSGKCQIYEKSIEIYQGQTIKAVSVVGQQPPFSFSDVATATYTVKGGDVERTDIPKLTLSPAAVTVPAAGQAVFSCTVDPQEYTHKKDLVAYVFSGKPGDIAKLEYQVGEKVNPNAWISYPEKDWSNFGTTYVSIIPNNTDNKDNKLFLIENGAQTVHYRLTLKLKEGNSTAPEMTFAAVAVSDFGAWSILNAEDPLAKAAVTFTVDETAKPTVAANPVFDPASGEIEPNTTVTITSATPGVQIAYVAVNDGDEDKTIDLSDADSYAVYSGGLWMRDT